METPMTASNHTSRLPGFYDNSLPERAQTVAAWANLTPEQLAALDGSGGLSPEQADHMIENVVGLHALPLGIAVNFLVNGREVLVPMAIEDPSVVAGASFMARLARAPSASLQGSAKGGGFTAQATEPHMIGQMQILGAADQHAARLALLENKARLLELANQIDPLLIKFGGGARDLEVRVIEDSPVGPFLVAHLIYDTRDAMGANAVNTACETLAPTLAQGTGGGGDLRAPSAPAPSRAATQNKGIMNGVAAVVIATGNDWRAIEAGAHAYAARSGRYTSLSTWGQDADGNLVGTLEMPMAVGIVGGATKVHPAAQAAVKLMNVKTASELAEIIVSVGLAQNMAGLRGLATER